MKRLTIFAGVLGALFMISCHGHAAHDGHDEHAEHVDHVDLADHDHGHDHEHEAQEMHEHEAEPTPGHTDEIVLSADKARAAGVITETVSAGEFRSVIPASGVILPAANDEATLVASVPGVVAFTRPLAEGSTVDAGERLFTISSENLQDGDPTERAAVAYETAKKEYDRACSLIKDRIISEKEFNAARSNYETAKIAYEAVARAKTAKGVAVVSPMRGSMTACLVKSGDYVSVGQPLARLSRNARLYLKVDVPERYYPSLRQVVAAKFKPSYTDRVYDTEQMGGRLLAVGKSAANASGYVPVTFEMNADDGMLQGAFAEVYLLAGQRQNVISLPVSAITEEQGVHYVYLQLDEECYRKQEVRLGDSNAERVEIVQGLKGGEQVVTQGAIHVKLASASNMIPAHTHNH